MLATLVCTFFCSPSDECDIGFLSAIHSSGSEFFLNGMATITGKNQRAKRFAFQFCEARQCTNTENPFKISCQYLANGKQDIFRKKNTSTSASWGKQCLIFCNLQQNKLKVQNAELFTDKDFTALKLFHSFPTTI